jgi:hypothetical protein
MVATGHDNVPAVCLGGGDILVVVVLEVLVASFGDAILGTSTHREAKSKWVGGSTAKSGRGDGSGGGGDEGDRRPRWEKTV